MSSDWRDAAMLDAFDWLSASCWRASSSVAIFCIVQWHEVKKVYDNVEPASTKDPPEKEENPKVASKALSWLGKKIETRERQGSICVRNSLMKN